MQRLLLHSHPEIADLDPAFLTRFAPLTSFGEYSADFIITVQGLIAKSERTNYPDGHLQHDLWKAFRDGEEIFRVLGAARRR